MRRWGDREMGRPKFNKEEAQSKTRRSSNHVIPVKTGIQALRFISGFPLEFSPMKIEAGMTIFNASNVGSLSLCIGRRTRHEELLRK
jgi:hypothetical protein